MPIYLYNTLTRKKEIFESLKNKKVGLYTCGPTVYNYAHIGNLRTYVFEDILKRVLKFNKYKVKHIMNITDVGHLTDDADTGEDKMEKQAEHEHKTAWEIAKFYTKAFKQDLAGLNILEPDKWCLATDHINEQIKLVQILIKKGFTYETPDGIYFDTAKITDYGKLAQLSKQTLKAGVRIELGEKKNLHDFALWKFSPIGKKRQMEWKAFGKNGFPGWHIECSAMSSKYLGKQFDIHCGGVDHIPIHHTNEIAQSESAFDVKPWVKYWLHGEFLILDKGEKMAKSKDNFFTLTTLKNKKISPIVYRYLLLQTHYRKQLNFSWEALQGAANGLSHFYNEASKLKKNKIDCNNKKMEKIIKNFTSCINDDLNIPEALALLWEELKNKNINFATLLACDEVLGLGLKNISQEKKEIPAEVNKLLAERLQARKEKNWEKSDILRDQIKNLGFDVQDTERGQKIT